MTIITYGGGEVLGKIFQSISMLFYGQGEGLIRALMILAASIAAIWVLTEAFFKHSGASLISRFFFPILIISHVLLLPQTTVRIEDIVALKSGDPTKKSFVKIDKVPFLLGKFAGIVSSFGYKLTEAIEAVMHVPDDISYNKTGHIFGAENLLEASVYKIQNADLEQNFRNYIHQCVFYDLALGQYSIDDLKKTSNLWEFFAQNTSKVRGIMYCPPGMIGSPSRKCSFCSCKDAIEKMRPYFQKEKNFYLTNEIFGRLPLSFQALTGLQHDAEELVSQQLVMNTMTEDLQGEKGSFAKSRAYTKQRETFHVLGALTAKSLVTMRNVLEALIYASFIFIAPISLLPGGLKFIKTWAGLVVWIQLWPPFFSILNYIMQIAAQSKAQAIFGPMPNLSFFTSVGLRDLYSDMHAVAGYLSASIPFISYAILKGGVGSFVHLASSIMSPAQSAAYSTAEEKTSGNYSFGNLNLGNQQAYNTSAFKRHMAPVLAEGFFSEDTGKSGVTYSSDGQAFYKQSKSELRTSLQKSDTFTSALQEAHQNSQSLVETQLKNYAENVNLFAGANASFVEHFSKNFQSQDGLVEQDAYSEQAAIHDMGNMAQKFGERFGLDKRKSMEVLSAASATAGGGVSLLGLARAHADISAKMSGGRGVSSSEMVDAANDFVHTQQFQEQWQKYMNISKQWNGQELTDDGKRFHEDQQTSYQQLTSSQNSLQAAYSNMEQYSDTLSLTQSNNLGVQQALDQAFINFASEKYHSFEKARDILDRPDTDPTRIELIQEFIKTPNQWATFKFEKNDSLMQDAPGLENQFAQTQWASPTRDHFEIHKEKLEEKANKEMGVKSGQATQEYQNHRQKDEHLIEQKADHYIKEKDELLEKGEGMHQGVSKAFAHWDLRRILTGPNKKGWRQKLSDQKPYFNPNHEDQKRLLERIQNLHKEE